MTRQFETGATRDKDEGKLDYEGFISPAVLRRYAEYMHSCRTKNVPEGQTLRASDNWQKGIPQEAYAKSLIRHVMEFWVQERGGTVSQETLCAIMFNVMGFLHEELKKPVLLFHAAQTFKWTPPPVFGASTNALP